MSQTRIISVSREELYEQVWTTPMIRLAKTYGVSDVGLAKACKRHKIPRPPRGHWAKLQFGKSVSQTPLPTCTEPRLQTVRLDQAGTGSTHAAIRNSELNEVVENCIPASPSVTVAERLTAPHRLVAATKRRLDCSQPGDDGIIHYTDEEVLPVYVSRKSVGRALRLIDALLKHWENLDGAVGVGKYWFDKTHVTMFIIGDDKVGVILRETTVRLESSKGSSRSFSRWNTTWRPSGKLTLTVHGSYGSGIRSRWSDGKRQRLENVLDSVISGLIRHVDYERTKRLDSECESRQKLRTTERREVANRFAEEETARRKNLVRKVRRRQQAKEIRQYVAEWQSSLAMDELTPEDRSQVELWISWAQWYSDAIDPLVEEGSSPLDMGPSHPENVAFPDLDLTSSARQVLGSLKVGNSNDLYRITRKEIEDASTTRQWGIWSETCRVLEGLGYDTSDRDYWL
jgi:hypothetical protein